MDRFEEDEEDAKTVLVGRRAREAWEDVLADAVTPVAEPARDDAPQLVDGSIDDGQPRLDDPLLRVEPQLIALAIGVLFPLLFGAVALLFEAW